MGKWRWGKFRCQVYLQRWGVSNIVSWHCCSVDSVDDGGWGEPRFFPKADPTFPNSSVLQTPDRPIPACTCADLRLPYNPNEPTHDKAAYEKSSAMFHCDKQLNWDDLISKGGVRLETTNRCHLFCDRVHSFKWRNTYYLVHTLQMLISITECKNGMWTGRPDLGYWCNHDPNLPITSKIVNHHEFHNQ